MITKCLELWAIAYLLTSPGICTEVSIYESMDHPKAGKTVNGKYVTLQVCRYLELRSKTLAQELLHDFDRVLTGRAHPENFTLFITMVLFVLATERLCHFFRLADSDDLHQPASGTTSVQPRRGGSENSILLVESRDDVVHQQLSAGQSIECPILIDDSENIFAALNKPLSLNAFDHKWPLAKPPGYFWAQGETFAARIAAYCKFSRVSPDFGLDGEILKASEHESQLCQEWVQEIGLNEATLRARHNLKDDKEHPWAWELRWVSKLFGLDLGNPT
jgi:hypothetical protein